ncbi:MAG: ArnT family glycosyltransferase [Thermoanaerobaculia bacterium]
MRRAVILLLLIGAIRIAATYTIFSETADEPMHLSAGLELLSKHQYTIHPVNPPLPRLLIALPPWLAGASFHGGGDYIADEVMVMYYSTGHYKTMLVLSRIGTLVFFLIGALATWAWARREIDDTTALVALLFFTTQPSILGHSGLATVDAAGTAGLAVAMLAFSRWLERPDFRRASVLGAAWGFAISCKLLCIVYVPLACAAIAIVRLLSDPETRARWRSVITIIAVPPAAAFVVWAGYGFSMSSAIPAPELIRGIQQMLEVNRGGFSSYAMRQWSNEGWWWYFPLTVALKTTLATLLFAAAGFVVARKNRTFLEAMAGAGAILGFSMPTHVNIGIRYILPIYVFLSVAAAIAALAMLRDRQKFVRVAAMVLVSWHLIASAAAHPDYLAYFNELAGRDPSRYLIDSNLDWGQDILRLRDEVRRMKIDQLGVALFGPANLEKLAFPPHSYVDSETPTHGWIAVSDHTYRWAQPYGGWKWLDREHCRRIGKSIRLCQVE